jgi:hypothetical protein
MRTSARSRFVGTIGFVGKGGKCQNSGREQDSLIRAKISLIARFNSLQGGKEFPVRMRREFACNATDWIAFLAPIDVPPSPESMKFPELCSCLTNRSIRCPQLGIRAQMGPT